MRDLINPLECVYIILYLIYRGTWRADAMYDIVHMHIIPLGRLPVTGGGGGTRAVGTRVHSVHIVISTREIRVIYGGVERRLSSSFSTI